MTTHAPSTFTSNYSQPDAYHFCQDSVIAPRLIAEDLKASNWKSKIRALDVCAGCGVMAFELLHALGPRAEGIAQFDFLEIQADFKDHFKANLSLTKFDELKTKWTCGNYSSLQSAESTGLYDLIIANPPYFNRDEGSLSPNSVNNRARFFLDADITTLLRGVRNALKPEGRAYILMKSGKEHGRDAFTSARIELFDCDLQRLADVRGTDLVRIIRT